MKVKVKVVEKPKKTISQEAIGVTCGLIIAATIATLSVIGAVQSIEYDELNRAISGYVYYQEEGTTLTLDDIYLVYKDDDLRKCYRKRVLVGESSTTEMNVAMSSLIGVPQFSDSKNKDYLYEFYDLETKKLVAKTDFNADKSSDAECIYGVDELLHGYEYQKLSILFVADNRDKDLGTNLDYLNSEYIEDVIKKFKP